MDYSKTIIYKITCNDSIITECYVGHTTNFVKRKNHHKERCNTMDSKLYRIIREKGGWKNWTMIPICEYPCENRIQACIKEEEYRIELQSELNARKCINTPKQYYEENKQQISEKVKEYQEKNKQQISEKVKEYREKNREQISEKNRKYYEENKEEIIKKSKEYYEKNKQQISEKAKEKYTCECGLTLRKSDKNRHEQTTKHQDLLK